MSYIYMDESGDLWFDFSKSKTSKYFVITFLLLEDPKPWEKIIKKFISWLSKNHKKRFGWVIHFHHEEPRDRIKVLSQISHIKASVMCIYLDKSKVYTRLQDEKHILYNYITNILIDRIINKKLLTNHEINLIVSKRETNKFLNENFCNYIKNQTSKQENKVNINISIEPYNKSNSKCLQLVDAICWSIFRKFEHQDDSYYQYIKNLIIEENKLFG